MISDKFIQSIPQDFTEGGKFITDAFHQFDMQIQENNEQDRYNEYIEYYSLVISFLERNGQDYDGIELAQTKATDIQNIKDFIYNLRTDFEIKYTKTLLTTTKERFDLALGNTFIYEFTDGDLKIIQNLINELRDIISSSELFSADHKIRILNKLEKLQMELHKKVSNLDRFWGLIGDAGVALGKFGNDAKPIVDRIKEIADIVWRTQARTEELPSGTKIPFLTTKTGN